MKIFKTLFLISAFLTLTFACSAQWSKLPGPTGGPIFMIKQVGNEIWAAGKIGLFTSSTNGLTWQQSNLITGMCHGLESYNDTVVILYVEYLSANFKAYTKSSFDGGLTWQQPVFIDNPTQLYSGRMFKTGKALYYERDGIYYKSNNGGMTWNLHMFFGGYEIDRFYTNGIMGIATVDMPGHLGSVYSLNGTNNWTFLDSTYKPSYIFCNNSEIYFVDYNFQEHLNTS
ncbi:MAG: hypothetical protein IPP71_10505 [Bacteroidetes bacterium]|nr:hypothetical protein [Bacteroidota bacterium]